MQSKARSVSLHEGILAGVISGLVLIAWWALWLWGRSPHGHMLMHASGSVTVLFVAGWTLMSIAMMLPTSLPLILLFQRMVSGRATAAWLIAVLVAGYLVVWMAFGVIAQWGHGVLQSGVI